ncbi:E2 [Macaca mulatta papillomavirus 6]|uniref:E2 n=1 Tax=Macaca mulatta papillomavirus 6 TaxID=2364646 RepID=UPI000EB688BB|nr:E2 [Macaca mulatta papillomavirus 6]AYD74608.1 E2 [Macaca mulatta papillomavirus 6]
METIEARLDVCQERLLQLYEKDSSDLEDQIAHWKQIRLECVLMYKAREMGMTVVNHQVVPSLCVSKGKAHQAIELQMALESLRHTAYATEPWTLQDASLERWNEPPKGCLKKKGRTIDVRFDGDAENCMSYVVWQCVYVQTWDTWTRVSSKVDVKGIYYEHGGEKVYYVDFAKESNKYGKQGHWEVHVGKQVMFSPASVSSTKQIPTSEPAASTPTYPRRSNPVSSTFGAQEDQRDSAAPPSKRPKQLFQQPHSTVSLDCGDHRLVTNRDHHNPGGNVCGGDTALIVHLKGDTNVLKCFRYRLKGYKHLFLQASSTWHWATCTPRNDKLGIVTLTYKSEEQRQQFLSSVKIPPSISASMGVMSI